MTIYDKTALRRRVVRRADPAIESFYGHVSIKNAKMHWKSFRFTHLHYNYKEESGARQGEIVYNYVKFW